MVIWSTSARWYRQATSTLSPEQGCEVDVRQSASGGNFTAVGAVVACRGLRCFGFATMCVTLVINPVVGSLDKRGRSQQGDRMDRRCRWIFPLVDVALNATLAVVAAGVVSAPE